MAQWSGLWNLSNNSSARLEPVHGWSICFAFTTISHLWQRHISPAKKLLAFEALIHMPRQFNNKHQATWRSSMAMAVSQSTTTADDQGRLMTAGSNHVALTVYRGHLVSSFAPRRQMLLISVCDDHEFDSYELFYSAINLVKPIYKYSPKN